jgi:hypothetical protein
MAVIPDFKAAMISDVIQQDIAPGSSLYTDALKSFGFGQSRVSAYRADNRIAQRRQISRPFG